LNSAQRFGVVRGRGYRTDQVDAYTAELSRVRDAAWERAARLTVLAREMEEELLRLREVVAGLEEQTYELLGERARRILLLAQEEAAALRETARDEARTLVESTREAARQRAEATEAEAGEMRGEAEERARQRLLAARAEADEIRLTARLEVKEFRGEAYAALREVRQRTEGLLEDRHKEQSERWAELERELAEKETESEAHHTELKASAEAALATAERADAEARRLTPACEEEAVVRAAEILAEARAREDRIVRETERVLRAHGEEWDQVRAHMDHIRDSLSTLTGRPGE